MEQKPIRIKLGEKSVLVFRESDVEGITRPRGFEKVVRQFLLCDTDTKHPIGGITFYSGIMVALSRAMEPETGTEYGKIENIEFALANLIPHLPLSYEHFQDVFGRVGNCIICDLADFDGYTSDRARYGIKVREGLLKAAQKIIFPNGMKRKDVEREILQILLNFREENPDASMTIEELMASIPLSTKNLTLYLRVLEEEGKIYLESYTTVDSASAKILAVTIKSAGIRVLEGEETSAVQLRPMVQNNTTIYGHKFGDLTTHGANSPINITAGDVNTALGDIIRQVKEKDFESKEETIAVLEELQTEMAGEQSPGKMKNLMDKLKNGAKWVYDLILSNPILTAYLTELLLKSL